MALSPPKPTGNAAPEAAAEGAPSKYVDDDEPNVTPEEQAEFDMAWNNALEIMYPKGEEAQVEPSILQALKAPPAQDDKGGRPEIMALANAAVTIVGKLDDSAREAGKPITDEVLVEIGKDTVEELGEIARAAKIYDYTPEDLTGAFVLAVDMYRPKAIADGRTSEDTLKGQFDEINQAEAAGKLGDVLPGVGPQTVGEPPVGPG